MFIIKEIANHCLNLQIIINLLFEHVIMTSKYSKQMQINSNIMVIYLTFGQREKVTQFILKLRRRSILTQKGKNIFCKLTVSQSTDR